MSATTASSPLSCLFGQSNITDMVLVATSKLLKIAAVYTRVEPFNPLASNLPREPSNPSNDVHLISRALVSRVGLVVGDDMHNRRIAVRDVLQPLGDEADPIMQDEHTRRGRDGAAHVDQDDVTIPQRRLHAVAYDMHNPQIGGISPKAVRDPALLEVVDCR